MHTRAHAARLPAVPARQTLSAEDAQAALQAVVQCVVQLTAIPFADLLEHVAAAGGAPKAEVRGEV